MDACVSAMAPLDLVVNCAAMSSPGKCEKEAELAMALNVPTHLCRSLLEHNQKVKLSRHFWCTCRRTRCTTVNLPTASRMSTLRHQ